MDFVTVYEPATKITPDFEILTLLVNKPNHRSMSLICLYKPPKGKVKDLIDFLKNVISLPAMRNREFWILGDLNVDWLKRDHQDTVKLMSFCKIHGFRQYIDTITRPNKKGGSCIDMIITNSTFVSESGILDDIISDHYGVYCVRKKIREVKDMTWKTVRDYRNFNEENFVRLLTMIDWNQFDVSLDPNVQWLFMKEEILNILSVMCPYKRVYTRKNPTLWITPEIYRLIREIKRLLALYRSTGCNDILKLVYTFVTR